MKNYLNIISLNNISIYLLLSFPAFLVVGPLLAEISMNLINIFFLYKLFNEKNFKFLKEKFFFIFIAFYIYIFLNIFLSNYINDILIKHIFYFRHIIFVFAVADLLLRNKNLILFFYKILTVTILIISIDGIIQFLFGNNILGFPKLRPDRLSGFFEDKMVLGSYIARLFPLLIGLFIYNLKNLDKKNLLIGIFTIIISFVTILLSGERMASLTSFVYVIGIFILLNYSKKIKFSLFFLVFSIVSILISLSPTLMDRHFKQTVDQVNFKLDKQNFFSNFKFYKDIYQTAFNGYLDNKVFGQGARSFRFFCSDKKFESVTESTYPHLLNDIEQEFIFIDEVFVENVEYIKNGDVIFTYFDSGNLKNYTIKNFEGKIELNLKSFEKKLATRDRLFINLTREKNGCTSHPHNFYIQLLSETGIIGFIFLFSIFVYLIFIISKNFILNIFYQKSNLSNFQICLLVCFITTLIPIIPNGNFFNNWLNMIMFLPVGFYIFSIKKNKK